MKLFASALLVLGVVSAASAETIRVYVGTYTNAKSKGVYLIDLDSETGKLSNLRVAAEVTSPSFLAIHPTKKYLYAVSEVSEGKKRTGAVTAFSINEDGSLKKLNHQSSEGAGPCHLVVDASGKSVLVANYGGGSIASLPIAEDGSVGAAASAIQHTGSSKNPNRQKEPHAHSINVDPSNKYAFAADLGLDKVLVYKLDAANAKLTANDPPAGVVEPGSGPRHFAFHPAGKTCYVINELANTVTAFSFDADSGKLTPVQTISTLPKDFKGTSYTAEVVVHPTGKLLFGSNRGHNSIASFVINDMGHLTATRHQAKGIKTPRNFAVDPTGTFLLVGNQDSDSIVVFRINTNDGELTPVGEPYSVPMPVCIRFLRTEKR
jgi:6-phosphogluconolactonase